MWTALKQRFNDQTETSLTYHIGIFNQLKAKGGETRIDFVERLTEHLIILRGMHHEVSEATKIERLLNGLSNIKDYQVEARSLELIPNVTWDMIVSKLRAWDRAQQNNSATETANSAESGIICHTCGTPGHKSPDCPNKINSNGKQSKFQRRGGGKGGGGGRGQGDQGRGRGRSRGGGGKGQGKGSGDSRSRERGGGSRNKDIICNCCKEKGHIAKDCPHAKTFATFLQKRKAKYQAADDDDTDYDFGGMVTEEEDEEILNEIYEEMEVANGAFDAALDSGCSSHLLQHEGIPSNTKIDNSKSTTVMTAKSGQGIQTLGRADTGILKNSLIAEKGDMKKSLISIPTFDREGCRTVFENGTGTVTDRHGRVIAVAKLTHKNLYEFDLRQLTEPTPEEAAMHRFLFHRC